MVAEELVRAGDAPAAADSGLAALRQARERAVLVGTHG
jgi:hypothetical protein